MKIKIDPHTLLRAEERGTNTEEIIDVIVSGFPVPASGTRRGAAKIYAYNLVRNNKFYEQKRVEVFYILQGDVIITVTVYVFYGRWEESNEHIL